MSDQLPMATVGKSHTNQLPSASPSVSLERYQTSRNGSWLHYKEDKDLAICFSCITTYQYKHLHSVTCLVNWVL